ncbi:excinuclease ABC subunit UvrC [Limisalsivibrio acetivorans]|uniref:excinuclease ABC subunit UvrC n=1 Tax=Limisalsivibrio acetivorans TaxID=1304888 RepID=UPI0003B3AC3A|nr:excinuclease ABC subunit UvrC [Limisalsivibrio acetivorans]
MEKYPLHEIPENPGVYLFIGKKEEILYVGKAKSLRSRVSSYFVDTDKPVKIRNMVAAAENLRFVVTSNEAEALLLEANLIKTEKPKYNVRLKDSKSYPYIRITNEDYPRMHITRDTKAEKHTYFGPFVNVNDLRSVVNEILRVFPLRSCTERKFKEGKLCLKYQIGKCLGPCEGLISYEDYAALVEQIKNFFKGEMDEVKERLQEDMQRYSEEMAFEKAAVLRDRLRSMDRLFYRQSVVLDEERRSLDVFVPHTFQNLPGITKMFVRNGRLIGSETLFFEGEDTGNIIETYIMQFYTTTRQFPQLVAVFGTEDTEKLAEALTKMAGKKVTVRTRGYGKLKKMALENAEIQTDMYIRQLVRRKDVGERLRRMIKTERDIKRIECIDISHISGNFTVGVSVAAEDGSFDKSTYRKYRIKSVENDDFSSIYELFTRKLENVAEGEEPAADLYIIDGGIGQLNAATRAADEYGSDALFISISKGRSIKFMKNQGEESIESIHLPGRKNPVILIKNDPLLIFVQKMRDEAHRFAISFSRKLALKNFTKSPLLEVEGLGEKRCKKLLETFPDIYYRKDLTAEGIAEATGIPVKTCENVLSFLARK